MQKNQNIADNSFANNPFAHGQALKRHNLHEIMVRPHELSAMLVVRLGLDLLSYQAKRRSQKLSPGEQLPRTRFSWFLSHYNDTIRGRNNAIIKAVEDFNRSRGQPIGLNVFKNAKQYAKCLATTDINDDGEVVYRGAHDPVWKQVGR